ncbi:nitric-oxide reductase large subunit [Maricaulis sp. D1M11]|uniref:nitric-oxide reductase large subunit n=1 Tax=Maricaulis sp. D1M11 TaxID=3076117 RepID=UPI0039B41569
MTSTRRLWVILATLATISFGALLLIGAQIVREAPPIPLRVETPDGHVVYTHDDIETGRQVWRSMGGMQLGSIWGHGGYVAPDWSADWLHREITALQTLYATDLGAIDYDTVSEDQRAIVDARVRAIMRTNTYDPQTETLTVSLERASAIARVADHYVDLFGDAHALEGLRESYAVANNAVPDPSRREALAAFFFWTSWAAATERPGQDITYTSNWPHEPRIDNVPTPGAISWSLISIVLLIAGIGGLAWYYAGSREEAHLPAPEADPLGAERPTPSMLATRKYFITAAALFLTQIVLGALTAHYAIEGHDFYGIDIASWIPYAVTRTWHTQLGIFWIATAWVGTGLYVAPLIGGAEPRWQALGVNLLFGALLVVVIGSFAGEWLAVQQVLDLNMNHWFGHQGYEFVDLGRFWQILLFVGLLIWLVLVARALAPALKRPTEVRPLVIMTLLSTIAIGLFYGAGLNWGTDTHLSIVEYWRWWVVHLWVEGFFEVFATTVIALLFVRIGLLRPALASQAVLFATVVFLFGGILGTLHHIYFAGTPQSVLAVGASFSALEVVPLSLIGFEAMEHYRLGKQKPWIARYRWAILFFVAVAAWNLIGAGVFGFLINPPVALYYLQGLNTTPVHAHSALFGVYGMLGLGLMIFCARGLAADHRWDDRWLKYGFWSLNIGLTLMIALSLLPYGMLQVWANLTTGFWYARSADFLDQPIFDLLVWMRVIGDVVFAAGAVAIAGFMVRLWILPKPDRKPTAALPAE